jgi:hypothetical protein
VATGCPVATPFAFGGDVIPSRHSSSSRQWREGHSTI